MDQQIIQITATKTQRCFVQGDIAKSKTLLIVLHGYGQLGAYFIRKFKQLSNEYYIVAPEGMHHFYLKGSSGRVGASWMTKEAREIDIEDNNKYLDAVLESLKSKKTFEKIMLLGFSQGGATAARWSAQRNDIDQLILWASIFPPDIEKSSFSHFKKGIFVIGKQDEFYDEAAQKIEISNYKSLGFEIIEYNGKHDIEETTLQKIFSAIPK
jgi:predicted esterase